MIKIKNDKIEKTVTKGAYENYYKSLGFEIVGEKPVKEPKIVKEIKEVEEVKEVTPEPVIEKEEGRKEIADFILKELKSTKNKKEVK